VEAKYIDIIMEVLFNYFIVFYVGIISLDLLIELVELIEGIEVLIPPIIDYYLPCSYETSIT